MTATAIAAAMGLAACDGAPTPAPPFGAPCEADVDCKSGLCLGGGVCSKPCAVADHCPPGPEWFCGQAASGDAMCLCIATGVETCDGRDNDCDGAVDVGAPCPYGAECVGGACVCEPGRTSCSGLCADLNADEGHCGKCNTPCPLWASCVDGDCVCPDGLAACDGRCVDPKTDALACGGCGKVCDRLSTCVDGKCACAGQSCDGQCVDKDVSQFHCGGCGAFCDVGFACSGGKCLDIRRANFRVDGPGPLMREGGVVRQPKASLVWQAGTAPVPLGYEDAELYCGSLSLDGYDDWRMPTRLEWMSLFVIGRVDPVIDDTPFDGVTAEWFWANGIYWSFEPKRVIGLQQGEVAIRDWRSSAWTRCVRVEGSYPDLGDWLIDGAVATDPRTELVWERDAAPYAMTYAEAEAHCDALVLGDLDDWRLPSLPELSSIVVEAGLDYPSLEPDVFPDALPMPVWVDRYHAFSNPTFRAALTMDSGATVFDTIFGKNMVRCVRAL